MTLKSSFALLFSTSFRTSNSVRNLVSFYPTLNFLTIQPPYWNYRDHYYSSQVFHSYSKLLSHHFSHLVIPLHPRLHIHLHPHLLRSFLDFFSPFDGIRLWSNKLSGLLGLACPTIFRLYGWSLWPRLPTFPLDKDRDNYPDHWCWQHAHTSDDLRDRLVRNPHTKHSIDAQRFCSLWIADKKSQAWIDTFHLPRHSEHNAVPMESILFP